MDEDTQRRIFDPFFTIEIHRARTDECYLFLALTCQEASRQSHVSKKNCTGTPEPLCFPDA
jgi:hypothetical protein